jgi:hypothetical protein
LQNIQSTSFAKGQIRWLLKSDAGGQKRPIERLFEIAA